MDHRERAIKLSDDIACLWQIDGDIDRSEMDASYVLIETALNEVAQEGGWISVEERLPQKDRFVLLSDGETVKEGYCFGPGFTVAIDGPARAYRVTHWKEKPAPPTTSIPPQEETGKETTQ